MAGEQTVTGRRAAEKTMTRSANRAALKDRRLNQGLGRATANAEAQTDYTRQGNSARKRKMNSSSNLIDIKVHAPHLAQWVKSEFDSMVEFGFPDDQLYSDTIETVKMIGGDLKLSDVGTDFYLFSDGTKLKITSSPSITCEVIK